MNSAGIRKTLRQGRGEEIISPLHLRLHRNDRLRTQLLKNKEGKSWNSLFSISHHPRKLGAQNVCAAYMCLLA